jgi:hypothetical protein
MDTLKPAVWAYVQWVQKTRIGTRDFEFDTIYVNGSNNLPNLKLDDESWKARFIEEEFTHKWSPVLRVRQDPLVGTG